MMIKRKATEHFALVSVFVLLLGVSCTPEENNRQDDRGDEEGSESIEVELPEDLDPDYRPYDSAVTSDACDTVEGAELSALEAAPNQALTLSFDCLLDADALTISVGELSAEPVQVSPTIVGFLVPEQAEAGARVIALQGDAGSVEFSIAILEAVDAPVDPEAYLAEVIGFQRELIENLDEPLVKEKALAILAHTEEQFAYLSEEEAVRAAAMVAANEDILGLQPNALCQFVESSPEAWWNCFQREVRKSLRRAAGSTLLAGAGLTLLGSPFAAAGIVAAGIGVAGIAYNLSNIAKNMLRMVSRKIQVLGAEAMDVVINKSTDVESREPFTIEAQADYTTYSGASMGEDATALSAFRQVIYEAQDLVQRVNDAIGTNIVTYTGNEPAQIQRYDIAPDYLYLELHPDTTDAISAEVDGTEITLTSTSSEPEPATIIVTYAFDGVRRVEKTIDVVVQPHEPCVGLAPPTITGISTSCRPKLYRPEEDGWFIDVSFSSDPNGEGVPKWTLTGYGVSRSGIHIELLDGERWVTATGMEQGESGTDHLEIEGTYTIEVLPPISSGYRNEPCRNDLDESYEYRVSVIDQCEQESGYMYFSFP